MAVEAKDGEVLQVREDRVGELAVEMHVLQRAALDRDVVVLAEVENRETGCCASVENQCSVGLAVR